MEDITDGFWVELSHDSGGTIVKFDGTGSCCWGGGTRIFLVVQKESRSTVKLIEKQDLPAPALINSGHCDRSCFNRSARGFTYQTLMWVRDNLLLYTVGERIVEGIVSPSSESQAERTKLLKLGFQAA